MLLYQFDAAVSRGFSWSVFKREEVSGFRVQGSGLWWQLSGNIYGAMPEGKWIAGFPFGISKH